MVSEREGASYEQQKPEKHKLCANNCGFLGAAATLNLCSNCYRDYRLKEGQEASAKSVVKKSLNAATDHSQQLLLRQQQHEEDVIYTSVVDSTSSFCSSSLRSDTGNASASSVESYAVVVKNRCFSCKKRVGLTGYKCRCGNTFCGTHRYAEKHNCGFDYKKEAREAIAKANPVVKAAKLQMI